MNLRVFNKVPNTYHTGKDDDRRAGAFYTYHGDRVRRPFTIDDVWSSIYTPTVHATSHTPPNTTEPRQYLARGHHPFRRRAQVPPQLRAVRLLGRDAGAYFDITCICI